MNIFIIVGLIGLSAEVMAIVSYSKYSKRYRLIKNTETSRITTLKKGFYEVIGKVVFLNDKLLSPLSQEPCVYYKFKVEEERSSGKSTSWFTVINDEKYVRFGLQDPSGIAYIEMKGAKLIFNKDLQGRTGLFRKASEELKWVMNRYGKTTHGWMFEKKLRYAETIIKESEELYILGEVHEMEGYYPVFRKGKLPFIISDKSEVSLLKNSRHIFQLALLIMIVIPLGIAVYLLFFVGFL